MDLAWVVREGALPDDQNVDETSRSENTLPTPPAGARPFSRSRAGHPFSAYLGGAVLIALVFATARTLAVLAVARGELRDTFRMFAIELVAGAVVGLWLVFVGRRCAGGAVRVAVAVGTVLFVNVVAVMIEGAAFQPGTTMPSLPRSVPLQGIVASLVGLATAALVGAERRRAATLSVPRHAVLGWLVRYAGCVLTYVVLYFVAGAINFALVTGPYYRSATAGLIIPAPSIVLMVATIEGMLFPAALLPLLYAMPRSRRQRALVAGASLAILGGVVPMILAPSLPVILRMASAVEIFLQKFPAGVAAAIWLGPDDDTRAGRKFPG